MNALYRLRRMLVVTANPNDDQAAFGLGVALVMKARRAVGAERRATAILARSALFRAVEIKYEFCAQFQSDVVGEKDKRDYAWYQEKRVDEHKFKAALAKKDQLIISVLIVGRRERPIATFFCDIRDRAEIDEVLSIVTGVKERSSVLSTN